MSRLIQSGGASLPALSVCTCMVNIALQCAYSGAQLIAKQLCHQEDKAANLIELWK